MTPNTDHSARNAYGDMSANRWQDSLPEALAGHALLSDDGMTLAEVLEQLIARVEAADSPAVAGLVLPAEDASDEDWTHFYASLGRPETPETYAFPVEQRPDWYSDALLDVMRARMFEVGLTTKQAQAIHDGFLEALEREAPDTSEKSADLAARLEGLRGEVGEDVFAQANRATIAMGLEEAALTPFYASDLGTSLVQTLASIGEHLTEDQLGMGATTDAQSAGLDAQSELERLSLDRDHVMAFLNPGHPGHRQAKATRARLIKQSQRAQTGLGARL